MGRVMGKSPDTMKTIIASLFLALFSASVGFGFSQMAVVAEVKTSTTEIQHLKGADKELRDIVSEDRTLMKEILRQNQEFIQLLKLQNELLMRKGNQ
jgi:hypothetical protein